MITLPALVTVLLVLVILGLVVYLLEATLPIAAEFKLIIRVVAIIFALLYVGRAFGVL